MRKGARLAPCIITACFGVAAFAVEARGQEWVHVRNVPLGDHPVGTLVCMDTEGDLLVIGFPTETGGVVRIHARNEEGLGQWGVVQELVGTQPYFGHAVAISGNKIAVGVPGATSEGPMTGAVVLCTVLASSVADPVQLVDTLLGTAAGDRFGFSLSWVGDSLAVGSVGRSLDRFTGEVPVFAATNSGAMAIGSVPARWQDLEIPFTRWFGMSLANDGDRMAVTAPYAGFRTDFDQQNIGALFVYQRNTADPSGWALDTVWFDLSLVPDGCTFAHLELGRNGVGFVGNDLVIDHGPSYDGISGNELVPFQSRGAEILVDGCADCSLRIVEHGPDGWSFDTMIATQQPAGSDRMAERGWSTDADALYVQRGNSATGEWVTTIHQRDAGGPGVWGVQTTLPALDALCDILTGPIAVSGDDLMRIAMRRSGACGAPADVQRLELQIFAR